MHARHLLLAVAALSGVACSDAVAPTALRPASAARAVAAAPLSITNLSVATGAAYRVAPNALRPGTASHVDRTFRYTAVPASLAGATFIRTANDDKAAKLGSTSFLRFTTNVAVTVYVAHDDLVARPAWLTAGFKDTGLDLILSADDRKMSLFSRAFAAGQVTLGSNSDKAFDQAMYGVVVVPSGATPPPQPKDTIKPAVAITAPAAGATVGGAVTITATATDAGGVAGVLFQVNGVNVASEDVSAPYAVSWNAAAVPNGAYTIAAVARDAAGNTATTSRQVTVSNGGTAPTPPPARKGHFVSPSATSGGTGTAASPWTLATALSHPAALKAGDTVWVRGGRYAGKFTSRVAGSSSAPIVVRQMPGERATIDGTLRVDGSYGVYWGFEITSSAAAAAHTTGLDFYGPGNRAVNLVVHDVGGNGIGVWAQAPNSEVYGNIVYNNGRQRVDPGFAHAIYGQNASGTTRIAANVMFHQMAYGLHLYGSDQAYLRNFLVEDNVSFNNGVAAGGMDYHVGGDTPVENLRFLRNNSYQAGIGATARFGYSWGPASRGATITDNYFVGKVTFDQWAGLTFQRNTLTKLADWETVALTLGAGATTSSFVWDGNTYFKAAGTNGPPFVFTGSAGIKSGVLADWRSLTGFDRSGTFAAGTPTGQRVVVVPNTYERGRATVAVYNWSGAGSATIDPSAFLPAGTRFEVRNVQTFYGTPVLSGTYGGGSITLPLSAVTPTAPVGGWPGGAPSTGTRFHAFVILPL